MGSSISFYDSGKEIFYHGLMLGLLALMDPQYRIKSNRESGDGRYDISLFPKGNGYPGIIMELKWKKDLTEKGLADLALTALKQISEMRYEAEMLEYRITKILKFGIAFSGKMVKVEAL